MATLAELVRIHARLDGAHLGHLQRLVRSWGPLADLSFADMLLYVPVAGEGARRFVVVGQIRPSTSQTVYRHDLVGELLDAAARPIVSQAFSEGRMVSGEIELNQLERSVVLAIPVRWQGEVIAVCTREAAPGVGRRPGELEQTYGKIFDRFATMIAAGTFPFAVEDSETEEAPRVGDGVMLVESRGRVEYASPNAVSALHRIGSHVNAQGMALSDLGIEASGVRAALAIGAPVTEEIERGTDVTVLLRCMPLIEGGVSTGGLVLLRDISELRRRDRLLTSMDATITEIHHRVKNNLQTISSLLRLQGRRLTSPEAKMAIEESVRRIRSIALVHETLSRDSGDDVMFNDIVRPLVRMVEESMVSNDRPIRFSVEGDAGMMPASIATPLAVVITELLQNALDHAFPDGKGSVIVDLERNADELCLRVIDDGVGVPPEFDLDSASGLGLSIVRSLVVSQVEGRIAMKPGPQGGTVVELSVPVHDDRD